MSDAPPPQAALRRERLVLALCVGVGFVLRFARWERTAVLFNDGPVFLALAERTATGSPETLLHHPFHPLYPLAIAALHTLGAPFGLGYETAGALVSALAGSAAVVALYALVRRAFGPREAIVAAWLLTFHAGAVDTAGDVQSEALYLAFFLAAVAALWRASEEGSLRGALLTGVFSGLAYLTRPEGLGVALVGCGLLALRALRGRLTPARALGLALAIVLSTAALVLPYAGALSVQSGELMLTRKKSISWVVGAGGPAGSGGLSTGQPGMEAPKIRERPKPAPPPPAPSAKGKGGGSAPERDPLDSLVAPPWTARTAPAAFFDLLDDTAGSLRPEIVALVLAGLFALRGAPGPRAGFFGALLGAHGVLLFALAMNVGYVSERHTLPPVLLLLGYAAVGVLRLGEALGGLGSPGAAAPRRARLASAALVAIVAAICLGKTLRRPEGIDELAERRAAEWVAEHEPGRVVAARKRRVAYYAGAPFVQLRPKTRLSFEAYFDDHGVGVVVVNQRHLEEYVGLDDLIGSRLSEVQRFDVDGQVALVFDVLPRAPAPGAAPGR